MIQPELIQSVHVNKELNQLEINLFLDEKLLNQSMTLAVMQYVNVHRSGGINKKKRIYHKDFVVKVFGEQQLTINLEDIKAYTYHGKHISMTTELHIDKSNRLFGFFTQSKRPVKLGLIHAPAYSDSAEIVLDPPDSFDLFKNIQVLSTKNQQYFLLVCILGFLSLIGNTLLGWHDQISPIGQTYFYSHYDSDGDRQSPLLNALINNAAIAGAYWFWMKSILRKYMTFRLVDKLRDIVPGKHFLLAKLISGKSRVNLENCELRVIACNIEHGQYQTGSGKNRRTHNIKKPIKCVEIYQKKLDHIPKQREIASYLKDAICFDDIYTHLAPDCMVSSTHGVKLHWEVQFIHPELVDQEVVGSADGFHFGHFIFEDREKRL